MSTEWGKCNTMEIAHKVVEANKIIYNTLSDRYEIIDGRRSQDLCLWVRKWLLEIAEIAGEGGILLDIGCGAGFVARIAKELFSKTYGIDISKNILKSLFSYGIFPTCGNAQSLPFKTKSVNIAVLFSVIHHFYDHRQILNEVHRVLKQGGIIYIDHDMNKYFFRNFHYIIEFYRKLSHKERFLNEIDICKELYNLSEYHSRGIDSEELKMHLTSLGFRIIRNCYHWYGLSKVTNFIFIKTNYMLGQTTISINQILYVS